MRPTRFRCLLAALAALSLAGAPEDARADDPDVDALQAILTETSAELDVAWMGVLVDHGQYDAALDAQSDALAAVAKLKGDKRAQATARMHAWAARAALAKGDLPRAEVGSPGTELEFAL